MIIQTLFNVVDAGDLTTLRFLLNNVVSTTTPLTKVEIVNLIMSLPLSIQPTTVYEFTEYIDVKQVEDINVKYKKYVALPGMEGGGYTFYRRPDFFGPSGPDDDDYDEYDEKTNNNEINPFDEFTMLHLAAFRGYVGIIRELLNWGADTSIKDRKHATALHYAVMQRHVECVKLLIDHGACFDTYYHLCRSKLCGTSLAIASYLNDLPMMDLLIACSADVQGWYFSNDEERNGSDSDDEDGSRSKTRHIINRYSILQKDNSPIVKALSDGYDDAVYRLLDAGSRCYDLRLPDDWSAVYGDQKCTTALHLATSLDIVKRLLTEKGGYKKYKATGDSPLRAAAKANRVAIVKYYLLHCHKQIDDDEKAMAALDAAREGYTEMVKVFLDHKLSPDTKTQSSSFLICACSSRNAETVRTLLDRGASIDMTVNNSSPLYIAIVYKAMDVIKVLFDYGLLIREKEAFSILQRACKDQTYNEDMLRFLINQMNHIKDRDEIFYKTIFDGCYSRSMELYAIPILMSAMTSNKGPFYHKSVGRLFLSWLKEPISQYGYNHGIDSNKCRALIEMGISPNIECLETKDRMLHRAIRNRPDLIETLLELGANVNARNEKGHTPLHIATQLAPVDYIRVSKAVEGQCIIKRLIAAGAK